MDFGDGKGPRWTFEMRESWGEGTQEQPKGSVSYLPYDEVCRLFEAFVVVGPWDRHAMRSKSLDTQRQCTVVMGKTIECSNVELSPEPVGSTQPEKPTHK
jgi:hypothetical protein